MRWDPLAPEAVQLIARAPAPVYALMEDAGSNTLMVGTSDGELLVLSTGSKQVVQRSTAHVKGVFAILALKDDRIAVAGGDGVLSIWQRSTDASGAVQLASLRKIPLCDAKLRALACSPSGEHISVACGDGAVRVLDTTHFNEVATCNGHEGGVNAVAVHPTKPVLVSGGKDGHLRVWDIGNGYREVMAIPAHRSTIYQIAFDPHDLRCASVSRDKTVKLWDAGSFDPLMRLDVSTGGHSHSVNALCWSGPSLFTGGDDRRVIRWTPE